MSLPLIPDVQPVVPVGAADHLVRDPHPARPGQLEVVVRRGRPADAAGAGLAPHADALVLLAEMAPGGEVERLHRPGGGPEEPLGAPGRSQVGELTPELGHLGERILLLRIRRHGVLMASFLSLLLLGADVPNLDEPLSRHGPGRSGDDEHVAARTRVDVNWKSHGFFSMLLRQHPASRILGSAPPSPLPRNPTHRVRPTTARRVAEATCRPGW